VVSRPGPSLTARWRPVDRWLAAYAGFVVTVGAFRLDQRGVAWIVAAHLLLATLTVLVTRPRTGRATGVLRAVYPVLLLPGLYSSIDVLNQFGALPTHDAPLLALEQAVFGMQPARDWWRAAPSTFWSTLLHAAYFSYYIVVPLPIVVFLASGHRDRVDAYLAAVIGVFLACYAIYIAWPVSGPYYQFAHPTGAFVDNAPARAVYAMLARGSAYGAAFPSSHVAATVAAAVASWRVDRRLGAWLAIPTVLLTVGVVYTQMHYVVDAAAGVALGVLLPAALGARRGG
jgi:hypothetical protein